MGGDGLAPWERALLGVTAPEAHEGDLVELTLGERVIRDRVALTASGRLVLAGNRAPLDVHARIGWTLSIIERAKPELPTGPGLYSANHTHPEDSSVYRLDDSGVWTRHYPSGVSEHGALVEEAVGYAVEHGDLVRLTPQ